MSMKTCFVCGRNFKCNENRLSEGYCKGFHARCQCGQHSKTWSYDQCGIKLTLTNPNRKGNFIGGKQICQ